ncbi:MAG: cyclin-dependent kinase inhibitor 3 family protein [Alphaproteobacteria bacterium]|nr:cyclin-dependent kinase inhibitor 3 family protein [Alphaproteobacteria bacterium]
MALPGRPPRDLAADLAAIRAWGAAMLVTLVQAEEFERYGVADFAAQVARSGLDWRRFPIPDMAPPDEAFAAAWRARGGDVVAALRAGSRVAMHCVGGLGRTGTVAARLLVVFGTEPEAAIARVRQVRPGAIETAAQADFVRHRAPLG